MERHLHVTLGGREMTLAATWGAGEEISEKHGDPLEIARQAMLEHALNSQGMGYDPSFKFTVKNVPGILHIAQKAGGGELTLEQVKEAVFEAGLIEAKAVAVNYIGFLCNPKSEEIDQDGDKGDSEKK